GDALAASGLEYALTIVAGIGLHASPLLDMLASLRAQGFDLVASLRSGAGGGAAAELLASDAIERALALVAADSTLGRRGPGSGRGDPATADASTVRIGSRRGLAAEEVRDNARWRGRTFIARLGCLAPLESLAFADTWFQPGSRDHEPALPEAIHRAFALAPLASGLRVADCNDSAVPDGPARVVVVSHDAHPHGAQLLALNMARGYAEMGFGVDMIVLGPGPLLERFAEVATVHQVDLSTQPATSILRLLRAMRDTGAGFAIANTTVSGRLVPLLKRAGLPTVSLIHELPGILRSYRLETHARAIAEHADSVVFPARIVKQGFEEFIGATVV